MREGRTVAIDRLLVSLIDGRTTTREIVAFRAIGPICRVSDAAAAHEHTSLDRQRRRELGGLRCGAEWLSEHHAGGTGAVPAAEDRRSAVHQLRHAQRRRAPGQLGSAWGSRGRCARQEASGARRTKLRGQMSCPRSLTRPFVSLGFGGGSFFGGSNS
eukprot:scaffold7337_cov220-Pinguiococcus_pyrenoidosus.AAC.3